MINIVICLQSTENHTKDFAYYAMSIHGNSFIDVLDDNNNFISIDMNDRRFVFILNASDTTMDMIKTKYTIK